MKKRVLPLSRVYRLLEPGPVVMLTTACDGKANIMTMSWHMMIDFEPPILGCVVSENNHSFSALKATRECVINIPTAELIEKVVGCGNTSGRRVDKFKKFGLTPKPASCVQAPLIDECWANLECRVIDTKMMAKYNLFILEGVKAWVDPLPESPKTIHHRGKGLFMFAGDEILVPSRKK